MQRKISAGVLPEIAAAEAGIPWEEAKAWLDLGRGAHDYDDDALRAVAARAMIRGLETLEDLAKMEQGRVSSSSIGAGMIESTTYPDLDAAKALLDAGIKIRRLLQGNKKAAAAASQGRDLFDSPPREASPWDFRKAD